MARAYNNIVDKQEVYDYLMTKPGMTDIKAKGIMANIQAESEFYSDAKEPNVDNPGIGLFQHTYPTRKSAFKEAVSDWKTNWKGQIDFAMQEDEMKGYMNHEPFDSAEDSTEYFMKNFEMPKNQSQTAVDGRIAHLETLGVTTNSPVAIIEQKEVSGTYNDWSKVESKDHKNGDIIKVGDNHYEYQDNRNSYVPHNIETGETLDIADGDPRLVEGWSTGPNPKKLPNGSKNPNYRANRNSKGKYVYDNIAHVQRHNKQGKLQEGDTIIINGKEYKFDKEDDVLVEFDNQGNITKTRPASVTKSVVTKPVIADPVIADPVIADTVVANPVVLPTTPVVNPVVDTVVTPDPVVDTVVTPDPVVVDPVVTPDPVVADTLVADPEEEVVVTPQNQTVLDADGNPVVIPTGEDVTEADLRQSETGEQTYTSWDELEQNMDNFDKDQPFYVGEGQFKKRYKWNAEKKQVQLVDGDGEYLADEVQVNNRELNDIFRENPIDNSPTAEEVQAAREGRIVEYQNSAQYQLDTEAERQAKIAEINALEGNVIIDPGPSNQEIIEGQIINPTDEVVVDETTNQEVSTIEGPENQTIANTDADGNGVPDYLQTNVGVTPPNTLNKLGQAGSSLLKGGAALLDSIGGPGAIISYVMGKKGLKEAMKEVKPQASAELSPMFMQHLRQSRELAKKGFHPDEARLIQKEMDGAFQKGLENAVRGSGGQRATFLAQSGVLDSQRSSALLEYAAQDAELQRKNADKYEKLIMFKENFDIQQTEKERAEDMARQVANKDAAAKFTSAAFTNVMSGFRRCEFFIK